MTFVHDHPDFYALIEIVATGRRMAPGVVEKDYWVTHALWALHAAGFDVCFKGGTSLSKGFNLTDGVTGEKRRARTSRFPAYQEALRAALGGVYVGAWKPQYARSRRDP